MKAPALALAALLALAPVTAHQETATSPQVERAFQQGGRISLDLAAGEYDIRGSAVDTIRIRWQTRRPEDSARVRAEVTVQGSAAIIRTHGPKDGLRFDIGVPVRTDLEVHLGAGELEIRDIEGSKDLSVWAGEVTVAVGDPGLYRTVDAAVRVGELEARPFTIDKEGILRSFTHNGSGKYTFRARLFAGELRLLK